MFSLVSRFGFCHAIFESFSETMFLLLISQSILPQSGDDQRRRYLYQLISREQHFVNALQFGMQRFTSPLRERKDLISPSDHRTLFQNIDEVWSMPLNYILWGRLIRHFFTVATNIGRHSRAIGAGRNGYSGEFRLTCVHVQDDGYLCGLQEVLQWPETGWLRSCEQITARQLGICQVHYRATSAAKAPRPHILYTQTFATLPWSSKVDTSDDVSLSSR